MNVDGTAELRRAAVRRHRRERIHRRRHARGARAGRQARCRAVDFISTVDTPYVWELNIWYHTLNAGFRTRISGETDFPCIYGERVGLGRSYVKLDGKLDYDDWCEGIRQGRNYVSDGKSHLMDFKVNDVRDGRERAANCDSAGPVRVKVTRPGGRAPEREAQPRAAEAPLTRNSRTGTSSAPASATRAKCRSKSSSTASPSARQSHRRRRRSSAT